MPPKKSKNDEHLMKTCAQRLFQIDSQMQKCKFDDGDSLLRFVNKIDNIQILLLDLQVDMLSREGMLNQKAFHLFKLSQQMLSQIANWPIDADKTAESAQSMRNPQSG